MTPAEILDFLTARGVSIEASPFHDGLDVSGPLSALTATLIDRLRARESELVAFLRNTETHSERESRARIKSMLDIADGAKCRAQELYEKDNRPPIDGTCIRVDRAMGVRS